MSASRSGRPPTVDEQVEGVLRALREVLGPDLVGAYLFGSAVLGGLRPRSDIDILAAARRPTSRGEKARLVEALLSVSGGQAPGPPRPVELTLVVESELRPWRYPPPMDFQYGEWLRRDFEAGNVEPWPSATNPDLASLITMVLLADRPLLGPPPTGVFDAVPRADRVRAMLAGTGELLHDLEDDTRNVVLTLARIWSDVASAVVRSKDSAADWALARLPAEHQAVLARARAVYLGDEEERWDDLAARVGPYAAHVVAEIERSVAATAPESR